MKKFSEMVWDQEWVFLSTNFSSLFLLSSKHSVLLFMEKDPWIWNVEAWLQDQFCVMTDFLSRCSVSVKMWSGLVVSWLFTSFLGLYDCVRLTSEGAGELPSEFLLKRFLPLSSYPQERQDLCVKSSQCLRSWWETQRKNYRRFTVLFLLNSVVTSFFFSFPLAEFRTIKIHCVSLHGEKRAIQDA